MNQSFRQLLSNKCQLASLSLRQSVSHSVRSTNPYSKLVSSVFQKREVAELYLSILVIPRGPMLNTNCYVSNVMIKNGNFYPSSTTSRFPREHQNNDVEFLVSNLSLNTKRRYTYL